jgi:WhiB family redox-sensing transcriptional regulator
MDGWWQAACCRGVDTDTFFPLPGDQVGIRQALRICESCPVRVPCRQYALGRRERYGIWGGLTEETREMIMREAAVTKRGGSRSQWELTDPPN